MHVVDRFWSEFCSTPGLFSTYRQKKLVIAIASSIFFVFNFNCTLTEESFSDLHWKFPLEIQSKDHVNIITTLDPKNCSTCHLNQYRNWKTSIHGQSISSAVTFQLEELSLEEKSNCLNCHSPLRESQDYLINNINPESYSNKVDYPYLKNENESLPVNCAACHVRNFTWFGPPSRNTINETNPHNGFKTEREFESSMFCKNCHESPESGIKLQGKKLMETYSEWRDSKFFKKDIQCQNCHMPDRNHQWKGIHDKEMVLSGIEYNFEVQPSGKETILKAILKSNYIGHKFPTYAVPKIYLKLLIIENQKEKILAEKILGRIITNDLTEEFLDTRLAPEESVVLESKVLNHKTKVIFRIEVEPEEMYIRIFQEKLNNKKFYNQKSIEKLQEILREKQRLNYRLLEIEKEI
jgi:hypothetical protein